MDQDPTQPLEPHPESGATAQPQPAEAAAAEPTPPPPPAEPSPWARPATAAHALSGQIDQAPASPLSNVPTPAQPYAPPAQQYSAPAQPYAAPSQPYGAGASFGATGRPSVGPAVSYGGQVSPTGLDVAVAPAGARPRRRNPLRYVVAALVVVLVVASGIGATLLLTGSSGGASALAGYAPADTTTYVEARLDLPGSQRAEVAKALAALPGFADQAALDTKLGELYDRVLRAATSGKHDYQSEIAPWFGGQIAIAEGPQGFGGLASVSGLSPAPTPTISPTAALPACTGDTAGPSPSPSPSSDAGMAPMGGMSVSLRTLLLANVTDATKAGAWVTSVLADTSAKTADRTCDGAVVHVLQGSLTGGLPEMGWAVIADKVLVAGDIDSIRLAIATKGTAGLSTVASFQKAVASLQGDHVGLLYEAVQAMVKAQLDSIAALRGTASGDASGAFDAMTGVYGLVADLAPEWVAGAVRASNGSVVLDTAQPKSDLQTGTNRPSDLAALAPAKTIALLDTHDLGKLLGTLKDKLAANPTLDTYVKQLDRALNLAGGFSGTVGWIGDAGLAITSDGSKVSGGILIRPDDASAATRLVTQLRALVELAGGTSGLAFKDEAYKGATITSVDLSALGPVLQSSMGSSGMTVPSDLQLVYAITDKVAVLTVDPSFARAVIDAAQGGDSLAKDARFSSLLDQAGTKNGGLAWLDLTAARQLVEANLPASEKTKYDADIRPYLLPFDALVSVNLVDGDLMRGTMILSIKH